MIERPEKKLKRCTLLVESPDPNYPEDIFLLHRSLGTLGLDKYQFGRNFTAKVFVETVNFLNNSFRTQIEAEVSRILPDYKCDWGYNIWTINNNVHHKEDLKYLRELVYDYIEFSKMVSKSVEYIFLNRDKFIAVANMPDSVSRRVKNSLLIQNSWAARPAFNSPHIEIKLNLADVPSRMRELISRTKLYEGEDKYLAGLILQYAYRPLHESWLKSALRKVNGPFPRKMETTVN